MKRILTILFFLFSTGAGAQQKFFMVMKSPDILDTLAGNIYLNSTGRVDDSTTSGWNNIIQSTAGTQTTSAPLKWKHNFARSYVEE